MTSRVLRCSSRVGMLVEVPILREYSGVGCCGLPEVSFDPGSRIDLGEGKDNVLPIDRHDVPTKGRLGSEGVSNVWFHQDPSIFFNDDESG